MSSKSCRACRDWEEHYYWNHMDDEKKHFFKLMPADFTQSMTVPGKFADNFNGHISEVIDLRSPSGEIWHVGAASIRDELVLQSGWKEFVSAHNVEAGDNLLFRYSGKSSFDVLIFDSSGCEKIPSIFVKKNELKGTKEAMEEEPCCHSLTKSHDSALQSPPQSPKSDDNAGRKEGSSSAQLANKLNHTTSSDLDCWWQEEVKHEVKEEEELEPDERDTPTENRYFYCRNGPETDYCLTEEPGDLKAPSVPSYILPERSCLTRLQEKKVKEKIRAIQCAVPIYVAILNKSNVGSFKPGFVFGKRYATAYLPHEKQDMVLQRRGKRKKWHVKFWIKSDNVRLVVGGWREFVRDNHLRQGDVCLFELMKNANRLAMEVHLIRKEKP